MIGEFIPVITLIVGGVMLANAIANPTGTKAIFDGLSGLWKTSVNGLLAVPSK
jgi:hypothetical protein